MKKIPVLLLLSSDIDLKVFNSSPRLSPYHFYSLVATLYLKDPTHEKPGCRLQDYLINKIKRVKPVYLIVHLGLAFERYSVEFLLAILNVAVLYPKLKIGMDRTFEYVAKTINNLDVSSERNELLKRLEKLGSSFEVDPETVFLAGLLR